MSARILVVDDDATMRWLLAKQLEALKLQSDSAADGGEALERLKKRDYQVILMDINMPGMDGYTTTRHIRQQQAQQQLAPVPIIAITANPDSKACLAAGMTDYLQKPIELSHLRLVLQKWLNKELPPLKAP
jgi:two-component system, sensor histidine kinase and response regulator